MWQTDSRNSNFTLLLHIAYFTILCRCFCCLLLVLFCYEIMQRNYAHIVCYNFRVVLFFSFSAFYLYFFVVALAVPTVVQKVYIVHASVCR